MLLEQQVRRNDAEMEEEEFWQNELQIEQESERQLRQKLGELHTALRDCEAKLAEYIARVQVRRGNEEKKQQQMKRFSNTNKDVPLAFLLQNMEVGVEQERLQQEAELDVKVNEEEVTTQTHKDAQLGQILEISNW